MARAVSVDSDSFDQFIHDFFWSLDDGGSGIEGDEVIKSVDGSVVALLEIVNIEGPVFLLGDLMGVNGAKVLGVHTWDDHVALGGVGVKVEREALVLDVGIVEEGVEVVDRNVLATVGKTQNSRSFVGSLPENTSGGRIDLTEFHGASDASKSDDIL